MKARHLHIPQIRHKPSRSEARNGQRFQRVGATLIGTAPPVLHSQTELAAGNRTSSESGSTERKNDPTGQKTDTQVNSHQRRVGRCIERRCCIAVMQTATSSDPTLG